MATQYFNDLDKPYFLEGLKEYHGRSRSVNANFELLYVCILNKKYTDNGTHVFSG